MFENLDEEREKSELIFHLSRALIRLGEADAGLVTDYRVLRQAGDGIRRALEMLKDRIPATPHTLSAQLERVAEVLGVDSRITSSPDSVQAHIGSAQYLLADLCRPRRQ